MSGIVVITTKGKAKRDFVNTLQEESGGAVALAVLQNVRRKSLPKRIKSFYKKVGVLGIFQEIYYFLDLKLSARKKRALRVLSARTEGLKREVEYLTRTIETNDVNEDRIYEMISAIRPDIIVILGGYIVAERLLKAARVCVNMHSGFVPYYRGVNGLENAILNNDFEHLGITIHYAVPEVDAGGVIEIVQEDYRKSPEDFFIALNDLAKKKYIDTIIKILRGDQIKSELQDTTKGRNNMLKEWTYKKQNALANNVLNWQKTHGT